jgi:hypothetical protein
MARARVISTNDRENMARAANPQWMPQLTYSGQAKIFLGGKEAQLIMEFNWGSGPAAGNIPAMIQEFR